MVLLRGDVRNNGMWRITPDYPAVSQVYEGVSYDDGNKIGTYPAALAVPPGTVPAIPVLALAGLREAGMFFLTPDFPAIKNVFHGVAFDEGRRVGTLASAFDADLTEIKAVTDRFVKGQKFKFTCNGRVMILEYRQ